MTTEERIIKLEAKSKAMAEEIERLKAELNKENLTIWKPKYNEPYTYISTGGLIVDTYFIPEHDADKRLAELNNVYRPGDETKAHLVWYRDNVLRVQNKLMQLHELLCPDYFPDWNTDEDKWSVYFDAEDKRFISIPWNYMNHLIVCFTKEAAEKACRILNEENFMG